MTDQKVNIIIDQFEFLGPLVSAQITASFYCALLLKQNSGIEITPDIEKKILDEVLQCWSQIHGHLEKNLQKSTPGQTPSGQ